MVGMTSRIGETPTMAFGQQSGPPATGRQIQELSQLLLAAGHVDFRDARGPMGFTQRQAGGKFTRDEAEAFIAQLEETAARNETGAGRADETVTPAPSYTARRRATAATPQRAPLSQVPAPQLAAELRRRGWTVTEP
jgi:hypothetical protein